MKRLHWFFATGRVLIILLFAGCTKTKVKDVLPLEVQAVSNASSIRLFNFCNLNADVSVNNIPLTNYGSSQATQTGLSIFPAGSWPNNDDGSPFTVPSSLLDKQGRAHILIAPQGITGNPQAGGGLFFSTIDTVLQDDLLHPKDYYVLSDGTIRVIPRNAAAPAQPDHFKIRIVNMMRDPDDQGFLGRVTLTYADGSLVSSATTGVDTGGISPYIELPLGIYQFKLFLSLPGGAPDFTKQLAELPVQPNFTGDAPPSAQPKDQESLFPKIRTCKAGATYSMVITKTTLIQKWSQGGNNYSWAEQVNAYRVVTEQSPAPNTTYVCMDAVNALRLPGVSIQVDGQPLGTNLSFGQYADHKIYIWGNHKVQATGQDGKVIAERNIMTYPNDYLTAWAYLNPSGQADLAFSSTDMSSSLYQTNQYGGILPITTGIPIVDDGTNGSNRIMTSNYNWQSRFLNLSEDIPYVTFGDDLVQAPQYGYAGGDLLFPQLQGNSYDSTNFASATINLGRGITDATQPFLMIQAYQGVNSYAWDGFGTEAINPAGLQPGTQILAFQSQPGPPAVVPGQLLASIPGLKWSSFIANPSMYTVPLLTPKAEPGFYSVALVGKVSEAAGGQAKLIYVKHNR